MAKYSIRFKKSVTKDLRAIATKDVKRILKSFDTLIENPRGEGCLKLSGQDRYRFRLGSYRIIYEIVDDTLVVIIVKVAHRSSVYKNN